MITSGVIAVAWRILLNSLQNAFNFLKIKTSKPDFLEGLFFYKINVHLMKVEGL